MDSVSTETDRIHRGKTEKEISMPEIIPPGATIGIIGGGQLGRMSAMAAAHMGYKVHIFTPETDSPASQVAYRTTVAEYTDTQALKAFARAVDVITFEFENIPHESLELLASSVAVHPSPQVLRICRNRLREKNFVKSLGIGTAPFRAVTDESSLEEAVKSLGIPSILKTTELGYDGKGQAKILGAKQALAAWQSLGRTEAVLEGFVDFHMEISVIVARSSNNETKAYVPVENEHKNHILHRTHVPARIEPDLSERAQAIAIKIADGLDLQGILAVEMFVTKDDDVLVNELAPRPHNSGHWSLDASLTSQFEQHIRAVCGLPLGDPSPLCPSEMLNLIGDDVAKWQTHLRDPKAKLHLYGKAESREGRKMGHVTFLK